MFILRKLIFTLLFIFLAAIATPHVYADSSTQTGNNSKSTNTIIMSNLDSDVQHNQHTLVQTVTIELLASFLCQLSGTDVINPAQGCLGINVQTHKIGYAPANSVSNEPKGLAGFLSNQIGVLYTPPASSTHYVNYLADSFGITKTAHAAGTTLDSGGLAPLLPLWKISRDIAYSLLVLVFVLIGVAVMLRVKIDPRTVMSVQNQIPKVIVSILLITFSYAIAGLMIDLMWTTTYVSINTITGSEGGNPKTGKEGKSLAEVATKDLLQTPFGYINQLFGTEGAKVGPVQIGAQGIFHITGSVSKAAGGLVKSILNDLFDDALGEDTGEPCFKFAGIVPHVNIDKCVKNTIASLASFAATILMLLVVYVIVLVVMFRIWFMLLKAYIFILFDVVVGPLWIVFGLLPGKPMGFEQWIRHLFAKLAVFPLTVLLLLAARLLMDLFNKPTGTAFTPPLVGNPSMENFGTILAFGALMVAPTLLSQLEEKLKVAPNKQAGAAIAGTLAMGAGAAAAVPKRQVAAWTARAQDGKPIGILAKVSENAKMGAMTGKIGNIPVIRKIPGLNKIGGLSGLPVAGKWIGRSAESRGNRNKGLGWKKNDELSDWERDQKHQLDARAAAARQQKGSGTNNQNPQQQQQQPGQQNPGPGGSARGAMASTGQPQGKPIGKINTTSSPTPQGPATKPFLGQKISSTTSGAPLKPSVPAPFMGHPALAPHQNNPSVIARLKDAAKGKSWENTPNNQLSQDQRKEMDKLTQDIVQTTVPPHTGAPEAATQAVRPQTPETPTSAHASQPAQPAPLHPEVAAMVPEEHKNDAAFMSALNDKLASTDHKGQKPLSELSEGQKSELAAAIRELSGSIRENRGGGDHKA